MSAATERAINEIKVEAIKRLLVDWDADGDLEFEDFIAALRLVVNA